VHTSMRFSELLQIIAVYEVRVLKQGEAPFDPTTRSLCTRAQHPPSSLTVNKLTWVDETGWESLPITLALSTLKHAFSGLLPSFVVKPTEIDHSP